MWLHISENCILRCEVVSKSMTMNTPASAGKHRELNCIEDGMNGSLILRVHKRKGGRKDLFDYNPHHNSGKTYLKNVFEFVAGSFKKDRNFQTCHNRRLQKLVAGS